MENSILEIGNFVKKNLDIDKILQENFFSNEKEFKLFLLEKLEKIVDEFKEIKSEKKIEEKQEVDKNGTEEKSMVFNDEEEVIVESAVDSQLEEEDISYCM